jgi:prepilin-type N-terminal cleavage/methylation domain-containing protein
MTVRQSRGGHGRQQLRLGLRQPCRVWRGVKGFTLLELITTIVVIAILASMLMSVYAGIQQRADKANCSGNLKSLYTGAALYVQEHEHWPQIDARLSTTDSKSYALQWYDAFRPYNMSEINWVCPTVQRSFGNPNLKLRDNARIDYLSTPFDNRPMTPYLWPKQPWFIERGAVHTGGNLMIFTNGQVSTLGEAYLNRQ